MKKSVLLSFLLSVIVITSFAQTKRKAFMAPVAKRTQSLMVTRKLSAPTPITLKLVDSLSASIQAQIDAGSFPNATVKKSIDSLFTIFTNAAGKLNFSVPVVPVPPITPPSGYTSHAVYNLTGASNQTIQGWAIVGGNVPCITLKNSHDIHITANKLSNSSTVGILLTNCYNITIDGNFITNVSTGVYVTDSNGGGIVVNYNQFLNMKGPFPRGQFVQFNTVSGAGLSISYNKGENILGSLSYPEDAINLYISSGTISSPIQVVGNWVRGGGPSRTGGGIMLGDNGGNYINAANNILVNPGQYGISISGGDHNSIVNNQVYGAKQSFTNVGIYVWGQSGSKVTNATVTGNQVNFTNSGGENNPDWLGTGETKPSGWTSNTWYSTINASILPSVIITMK